MYAPGCLYDLPRLMPMTPLESIVVFMRFGEVRTAQARHPQGKMLMMRGLLAVNAS